jgi:hypothetical protein
MFLGCGCDPLAALRNSGEEYLKNVAHHGRHNAACGDWV